MKKKQSIIALVLAAIVTVLLGWTMIKGWGPTGTGSMKNINLGLDLSGGVSITYQAVKDNPTDEEMSDTRYKLEQRAQQYSEEAQVYLQGDNRITIEIPGATDATTILEEMGKPGSLYFIKQTNDDGTENYTYDSSTGEYVLNGKTIEELEEDGSVVLTGKDVESAEAMHQQNSTTKATESVVQLKMTDEGKQKFADATQEAYSAGKSIGIYYDEKFVSVPSVNAVISDGTAVISGGNMDWDEATSLASTLRIGSLSLKLEEINSSVVGAQLGSAAVSTSVKAGAIGIILIIIFLAVVYRLPGIAAGWALLIYVELNLISLNAFAQEKATGKAYKAIQKDEKVINKDLQKKAIKEARKEAKALAKEGFKTPVGKLPLDKQLENSWEKQMEIDMNGNPYWYIATARVIGGNQSAAAMQATNTAKIDIAGQVQTKVTQLIESKVANDDMGQEEAASLSSAVAAGKSIISGTLGRTIPLVEVYRTLPNKNVEVMVAIGYSLEAANKVAVKALSEELAKKSPELAKELDKLAQ